jgi:WD40 repeat protein
VLNCSSFNAQQSPEMFQTIGHYRLLQRLGSGTNGQVWKAEDLKLKRTVAIKLFPVTDDRLIESLQREARMAAALNHPNVATVYEFREHDSCCYLVIECVEGQTLNELVSNRPIDLNTALSIAIQVADAIRAAHARGLLHCDIKSSNIMITSEGSVKVLDFGLARLSSTTTNTSANTKLAGTPAYMSPEQIRGELLDGRTDIFSLGIVLYEMLTAKLPFSGEERLDTLQSILRDELRPISTHRDDVPLQLESVVRKALAKERVQRYSIVQDLISDLRSVQENLEREGTELPTIATGAAFRGLLPFHEADRDRFYGRDGDIAAAFDMIRHLDFRFGVLFGHSGCGKTSLLRAGLLPVLWREGYVPVYCRSYNDPLSTALEECRRGTHVAFVEGEAPANYFRRVARELDTVVVLVCDQFEEFFVAHRSAEERAPFVSFIAACYDDEKMPVKFLASMRSDFLYLISSELGQYITEPLISSRLYHLRNFDETQAREIIDKSARRAGLPFANGLSRQVAADLADGDTVAPSELQIVGEQLQNKRIYTVEAYRRAGGKEPLVHSFLEDVIRTSGDADGARLLLRSLISEENTRLTLPFDEIAKRTQRGKVSLERLLHLLVRSRLVRELQEDTPWRYELMHEYLIEKINQVTGKVMDATQRANRLFRQYLSNYLIDDQTRIPVSKLWFIKRHSDITKGGREKLLLRKSLRWGLIKLGTLTLLLAAVSLAAAVAFSLDEEWEGNNLTDGHTAAARKAVFSPDGRLLVSVGEDGKIIVWDFARRERLATFAENGGPITTAAFSPDGKWFATPGAENTVVVRDATRFEKAVVLRGHVIPVHGLAFSPDGRLLASTSGPENGRTIVWETASWNKTYEISKAMIFGDLSFAPDSHRLMIGPEIWNLPTGSMVEGPGSGSAAYNAISTDGRRMVGVSSEGNVVFYDVAQLWTRSEPRVTKSLSVHSYHGRAVAFSPDGKLAASGSEDIVLWDAVTETKLARLKHSAQIWSLVFSPDGRLLISTHDDGSILIWDVAEREQAAGLNGHTASVHAVAFSPDGKHMASVSEDRSIIVWNSERREKEAVLIGHTTRVTSVAFSPDGKRLASSDMVHNTILWDLQSRKQLTAHRFLGVQGRGVPANYCVAFSPDGRFLVTNNAVYDASELRMIVDMLHMRQTRFNGAVGATYGAAFSPDSKLLACSTDSGALVLWDTKSWNPIEVVKPSNTPLISISFGPNGKTLVTGDDEGFIRYWEVNPLRQIATLGRHAARTKSVAFSPDGTEVASAGDDRMVYLWDVARQRLITRIGTHTSPVLGVAFSPNGRQVVSGEHDNTVRIFTRHRTLWGRRLD